MPGQPQKWTVTLPVRSTVLAKDGSVTFTGWASVVTAADGTPIVDHDGDVIPIEELERAVHKAALESTGAGRAGIMHQTSGQIAVIESLVLTAAKRKALDLPPGPEGWIVTCRSTHPEVIEAVKGGSMLELSIKGEAERVPIDG